MKDSQEVNKRLEEKSYYTRRLRSTNENVDSSKVKVSYVYEELTWTLFKVSYLRRSKKNKESTQGLKLELGGSA